MPTIGGPGEEPRLGDGKDSRLHDVFVPVYLFSLGLGSRVNTMSKSNTILPQPMGGVGHEKDQSQLPLLGFIKEVVAFSICVSAKTPFFVYLSLEKVVPAN
jgi:hypothetical protein